MDQAALDLIRVLTADTGSHEDRLLDDNQLGRLYVLNGGNARLTAADALDVVATSEVLVSKKIRTQDLQTDGPAVSAELRAQAKNQRALAQKEIDDQNGWDGFDVVDTIPASLRPEHTAHEVWGL